MSRSSQTCPVTVAAPTMGIETRFESVGGSSVELIVAWLLTKRPAVPAYRHLEAEVDVFTWAQGRQARNGGAWP